MCGVCENVVKCFASDFSTKLSHTLQPSLILALIFRQKINKNALK
jgi:hypothetical protein